MKNSKKGGRLLFTLDQPYFWPHIDCIVFRTGVLTSFICNRRCVDNVVCIKLSALDPGLIMNRFRGWNLFNHIFQKCGPLLVQSHQKLSPEEFFCKKINPNIFWVCNFEGYLAWFALWSFSIIFNDCIVGSILQSIATVKCSFFEWCLFIMFVFMKEDEAVSGGGWRCWLRPSVLKVPFALFNLESVFEGDDCFGLVL